MKQYLDMLRYVMEHGERREDRTGTGTVSVFAPGQMVFDMKDGFPLVTTKKMFTKGIVEELLWFLRGDTNVSSLSDKGVHIWDGNYEAYAARMKDEYNVDPCGDLGPIYGKQWRGWSALKRNKAGFSVCRQVDQITSLIDGLVNTPCSRRHIVSAWNVAEIADMALPPCHCMFQCYVSDSGELSLSMYQRSADMFLGVPFNIASYALLLHILCEQTGYKPGRLIITLGDAHIYLDHLEQVREQLSREPFALPWLSIDKAPTFDGHTADDFHIHGYKCHPAIKAEMSV